MSKQLLLFLTGAFILCGKLVASEDVVHHPQPKDPVFVSQQIYATLQKQVSSPPKKNDKQQMTDEAELRSLQKSRTPTDCERAKSEVYVNLGNFFGTPHGSLDKGEVAKLSPFFDQLRNDGDFFIQKLKIDFPRPRPFNYIKGLEPCVAKEVTQAYPSGHAALSHLYALVLSDFYPKRKAEFMARAKVIGRDRVLSGMHHPSDIDAGRKLADFLYLELVKSPVFQAEFAKNKPKA